MTKATTKTRKKPLRGKPLLRAIIQKIERHPELHTQQCVVWKKDCGTSHCIAGWALVLGGKKSELCSANRLKTAAKLLGMDYYFAWPKFFFGLLSRDELFANARAYLAAPTRRAAR